MVLDLKQHTLARQNELTNWTRERVIPNSWKNPSRKNSVMREERTQRRRQLPLQQRIGKGLGNSKGNFGTNSDYIGYTNLLQELNSATLTLFTIVETIC